MSISLRCILGHKWEDFSWGDMIRICDNKPAGSYVILRCSVCGKMKQHQFK